MLENEVMQLLNDKKLPCLPFEVAVTPEEAVEKAGLLGFPVVMKILSPDIWHKTDVGGVRIGIQTPGEIHRAFDEIQQEISIQVPYARQSGVILYPQVNEGPEIIIGVTEDNCFGPVIMFGLGGIFVEVLQDVTFRALPINEQDALGMLDGIKNRVVLDGCRGYQKVDKSCLVKLLCQISHMIELAPEIVELDLNPVRFTEKGWVILDAKIKLKSPSIS